MYRVNTAYHQLLFRGVIALTYVLFCAGNNHNPFINQGPPQFLPLKALLENGTPMPGLGVLRGYILPMQPDDLNAICFWTIDEVRQYIRNFESIYVYYFHWILDCMQNSLLLGPDSVWNFGAPIGMSKEEFFARVSPALKHGGNASLRRLISDPVLANEMDFSKSSTYLNFVPY